MLLLLFGGGGGYYGYSRWGGRGGSIVALERPAGHYRRTVSLGANPAT